MKKNINDEPGLCVPVFTSAIYFTRRCSIHCYANGFPLKKTDESTVEGRWDLTMYADGKEYPSWLEIRHSGTRMLVGHFVFITGSARPISKVNFKDGKISFTLPPQWEPAIMIFL
jgi:hypothetical protein